MPSIWQEGHTAKRGSLSEKPHDGQCMRLAVLRVLQRGQKKYSRTDLGLGGIAAV